MKLNQIIFSIFFLCLGFAAGAQSLSFSQILMVSSTEDTVPPDKVWKIEGMITSTPYHYTSGTSCTYGSDALQIYVNGNSRYMHSGSPGTGSTTVYLSAHSFPFWVPSGTRLRTNCASTTLSIIEFNVVP